MYSQNIRAGFFEGFGKFFRFLDHQVDITNFAGGFTDVFNDRDTKANIGNKTPVHNIQMKPFCFTFIDHFAFLIQLQEIRG